jgi:DNA-directed RNA polymerase subunit F
MFRECLEDAVVKLGALAEQLSEVARRVDDQDKNMIVTAGEALDHLKGFYSCVEEFTDVSRTFIDKLFKKEEEYPASQPIELEEGEIPPEDEDDQKSAPEEETTRVKRGIEEIREEEPAAKKSRN